MLQGLLFDIRRYSVHDGPGIRTTVFFKGCPLNCPWCHNPEGISFEPQSIWRKRQLNGKQEVVEETVGRYYTSSEVMEQLELDLLFFEESGGGVTFSGGEPLSQPEFLKELLIFCREAGIHTAVDTSGYAPMEVFSEIASLADMILLDLKTCNLNLHKIFTKADGNLILDNLYSLKATGPAVIIRIPIIPQVNYTPEHMESIIFHLKKSEAKIVEVNLLPYHRLGYQKYEALGMETPQVFEPLPVEEKMKPLLEIFEQKGYRVKLGG